MLKTTTRRIVLAASATLAALALAGCGGTEDDVAASNGDMRGDNVLGDPNAPVTIIEYASITCPHCKTFHDQVFDDFKEQYIDTGKVRFVFREFPTSPSALALAGFLMARCAPEDKYFDVLGLLFEKQNDLVNAYRAGTAREELLKIARPLGISETQFDACVRDSAELERIERLVEDGMRDHDVGSTPSFVIDGETYVGAMPLDEISALVDPLLGEAS